MTSSKADISALDDQQQRSQARLKGLDSELTELRKAVSDVSKLAQHGPQQSKMLRMELAQLQGTAEEMQSNLSGAGMANTLADQLYVLPWCLQSHD